MTIKHISQSGDPVSGAPLHGETNPRQRILVVEDDAAIRRLNTEILTYSGYHVDAAEDGAVAWDALQQNNYDLMVTDNDMPKVTGVEFIRKCDPDSVGFGSTVTLENYRLFCTNCQKYQKISTNKIKYT